MNRRSTFPVTRYPLSGDNTAGAPAPCGAPAPFLAMPVRPALPMNRAVFHRLGLSVGIAIALAGCGRTSPFDPEAYCNVPADDIQYSTVRSHLERGEPGASLVPQALADGVLTDCEYNKIILAKSGEEVRKYAEDKRALQKEFAQ